MGNEFERTAVVPRPLPRLDADAHKGDAGRVLCVAGSARMPGAAILVARAAQRAGAGLVTLACLDRELMSVVPAAAPEAILVDLSDDFGPAGELRADNTLAQKLLARAPDVRLLGPGIGDDARARTLLEHVLSGDERTPLALDADALNALGGRPERLRDVGAPVILTPHPGEARRLMGTTVPRDPSGRLDFARRLAARAGALVCLKGAGTVVTDGESLWTANTGNAGMATAGSGDVLAGILVAYLALCGATDGWNPVDAARAAVHVHGLAGDLAAEELGQRALIASDLIRFLPAAQRRFEGRRA